MRIQKYFYPGIATALLLLVFGISSLTFAGNPIALDFAVYQGEQDQVTPAVAYNPQLKNYLVVWSNDRPGNDDIYARRITANGKPLGGWISISAGAGFERRYPDVAYNEVQGEFLVVWEEEPHGGYLTIRGLRVSKNGEPIPPVINISSGPALKNCQKPSVAYASTSDNYLVIWDSMVSGGVHSYIEAQVISNAGVKEGLNFLISGSSSIGFSDRRPDLAYNRSRNEYLAVFERLYDNATTQSIYGRLVTGDGTALGSSADVISVVAEDQLNPVVAAIPTVPHEGKFFVAWESQYSPGNNNIYGKRFTHDLKSDGIILMLSNSPKSDSAPAVAADEYSDQFLVAWKQPWGPFSNSSISTRYISKENDTLEGEITIGGYQTGMFSVEPAVVSGMPGDFLVAFSDTSLGLPDSDIFGQLLGNRQYIPLTIR